MRNRHGMARTGACERSCHCLTTLERLPAADDCYGMGMPKSHHTALMHVLCSVTGTLEWLRMCEPQSSKASLNAMAESSLEQAEERENCSPHDTVLARHIQTNWVRLPATSWTSQKSGRAHE